MTCPIATLRRAALAAILVGLAGPALGQGEGSEDRRHWDWGQHRTSLVAEDHAEPPAAPVITHDHWDYPGAPVRFAGRAFRG